MGTEAQGQARAPSALPWHREATEETRGWDRMQVALVPRKPLPQLGPEVGDCWSRVLERGEEQRQPASHS